MRIEDLVFAMLVLVGVVSIVVGVTFGVVQASTLKQCLALGYPSARIDYMLTQYCVKRVDQTDVVVPLELAKERVK